MLSAVAALENGALVVRGYTQDTRRLASKNERWIAKDGLLRMTERVCTVEDPEGEAGENWHTRVFVRKEGE